jgi:hypothetical protein
MAEEIALFDILLSAERSTEERLAALVQLRPFLETQEGADKLAAAINTEESTHVKGAMLEQLCNIDISRINNHQQYISTLSLIACLEPERELRYMAVTRLAFLAPHVSEVQEILIETLVHDIDSYIQIASIQGLQQCVNKTTETIEKLSNYLPFAPAACKGPLLTLVAQLPQPHATALLLHFLDPLEPVPLRLEAVRILSDMPSLPAIAGATLTRLLPAEVSLRVRSSIIALLANQRQVDPELFNGIFTALQQMPDQPELLALVADRLVAHPELQQQFIQLFSQTTSAGLRIRLLVQLQYSDVPEIIVSGLQDANPYVREATLPFLTNKFAQFQDQLEPALAKAIQTEPLTALRRALIQVFLQTGRKSATTEDIIVALATAETDHPLKVQLAQAACQVTVTAENRQPLLRLFCGILEGKWYPAALKEMATARLQTFAYSDDPDLKKSMGLLLDQAKDIHELNRIYGILKTLETDFSQLAPSLFRVLYRHIGWYPQQPLDQWVQLLGQLAEQHADIRAELPYLVAATGANWLLKGADKADQTGAFLSTFKNAMLKNDGMRGYMEMERLLADAWNNRTIKKNELIELYTMLLRSPKSSGLLQQVLNIMQQGKLVPPELVTLSLDYILVSTDKDGLYLVRKYLEQAGFNDLEYRQRLINIFTQQHYAQYMQHNLPEINSKRRITNLNDWEYSGWLCPYNQWPVANLIFAIEPGELATQVFSQLPAAGTDATATLPYLVLEHLFRNYNSAWAKSIFKETTSFETFLTNIYNGYQQLTAANPLGDRMLYTFWKKWSDYVRLLNGQPVPAALSDAAAHIYTGVCNVLKKMEPEFNGRQFPQILNGMNKDIVQQHWPWSNELWETFEYKYFPKKDPDQEAAVQLFQQAAKALQAGDGPEGLRLLKDLVARYPHTRQVKEQLEVINNAIAKLEGN